MNTFLISLILSFVIAGVLSTTRSRDDADKPMSNYGLKVMIVTLPVIYLGLVYLGGSGSPAKMHGGLDMHMGAPDF